jgi:tetratricopeptide (TPR) repeat protein
MRKALPYFLILAAVFIVYGQSVTFDFTGSDEQPTIVQNGAFLSSPSSIISAFSTPYMTYYRPALWVSYIIDYSWGHSQAYAYHATNIALLALTAIVLFSVVQRLTGNARIAALISIMFAVHPLATEAVAWIPGRNDLLSAMFMLLSFLMFLRYLRSGSTIDLVAHQVGFLLALFSKESAIVLPIICLLYMRIQRKRAWRFPIRLVAPYVSLVLGWYVLRQNALKSMSTGSTIHADAIIDNALSLIDILGKCLLPIRMSVFANYHPLALITGGVVAVGLGIAYVRWKERIPDLVGFGLAWFVIALLPSLFVRIDNAADFFDYLECRAFFPMAGMAIALASLLSQSMRIRIGGEARSTLIAGSVIIGLLGFRSALYAGSFRNQLSLDLASMESSPLKAAPHYNLGRTYLGLKDYAKAEEQLARSIELNPSKVDAMVNLCQVYNARRQYANTIGLFRRIDQLSPRNGDAYFCLAEAKLGMGDLASALDLWPKALALNPANAGLIAGKVTQTRTLITEQLTSTLNQITGSRGGDASLYNTAGAYYTMLGKYDSASAMFSKSLGIDPSSINTISNLFLLNYQHIRDYPAAVRYGKMLIARGESLSTSEKATLAPYWKDEE